MTAEVEEILGGMLDGWMAWLEKSTTNGVAEDETLGVDGVQGDGEMGRERIEDGARGDGGGVRKHGSDGGTKGNFLDERIGVERREGGKGNRGRGRARSEGDGGQRRRASGGGDGGGGEFGHGEREQGSSKQEKSRNWVECNKYRSHVTKDGSR